jgi:hypothetical protein
MAIVADGTTAMNFTFRDRDNNTATLTLYAPSLAVTEDVAAWASGDGAVLVQALSNAVLTNISVIQKYVEDAPATPAEASDVERKGVFSFNVEGAGHSTFRIPSFINEKVIDGTKFINTADTAVAAFIAAMVDSGLFDTYQLGNFRGDPLETLVGPPYKTHVGSNKG